jgi:dCMP deaminase
VSRASIHAEENALLQCAIHSIEARGATLYTTASTCYDCFKRIAQVGIVRIVYAKPYDGGRMQGRDLAKLAEHAGIELVLFAT